MWTLGGRNKQGHAGPDPLLTATAGVRLKHWGGTGRKGSFVGHGTPFRAEVSGSAEGQGGPPLEALGTVPGKRRS